MKDTKFFANTNTINNQINICIITGKIIFIWQNQGDQPWQVSQPNNSFLTGYFEKDIFQLNITGSTDLDVSPNCTVQNSDRHRY